MITTLNEWRKMNEEANFPAAHDIDDMIEFVPMYRQQQAHGISAEVRDGKVVAVRFSKMKVFYDILDIYYGVIFDNVDSSKVYSVTKVNLIEEPDLKQEVENQTITI